MKPCPGHHFVVFLDRPFGAAVKHEVHDLCTNCRNYQPGVQGFNTLTPAVFHNKCVYFEPMEKS